MSQLLVPPNMNVQGAVGWCLSFQDDVYDTGHPYTRPGKNTARYALDQTKFRHFDQNFPKDVPVIVWWRYRDQDHVMTRLPDGRYYGSPWKLGTTQAIVANKAEVERIYSSGGKYPLTYVCWTEDISGKRIVNVEEEIMSAKNLTRDEIVQFYKVATLGEEPPKDHLDYWEGRDAGEYGRYLLNDESIQSLQKSYKSGARAVTKEDVISYLEGNLK